MAHLMSLNVVETNILIYSNSSAVNLFSKTKDIA